MMLIKSRKPSKAFQLACVALEAKESNLGKGGESDIQSNLPLIRFNMHFQDFSVNGLGEFGK